MRTGDGERGTGDRGQEIGEKHPGFAMTGAFQAGCLRYRRCVVSIESVQFIEMVREAAAVQKKAPGIWLFCENCGQVTEHISSRVEELDEIYVCNCCHVEKWFRTG